MKLLLRCSVALTLAASLCPTWLTAEEAPRVIRLEENLAFGDLLVLGEAENVHLPEFNVTWPARIDTGATTTSIHAVDIEIFERDGKEWVRFTLRNDEDDTSIETSRPVERMVRIKKRESEESHQRAVVQLDVTIGEVSRRIEVNLTDRGDFEFPLLIGRNFLQQVAIVDVSQSYVQDTPQPAKEE
ncbi:hypothetical protein CLV78_103116 [Aliiruegeria haliotis]|uniref:Retropepsin-like aspartic endopeptidase domain-containing protein n=1 Tax=Aliiruegeria haliotis TaxID=1280846 RepID=A0A2T0RSW3_9RHOB|nr:ATP-dependent zinc protease [Aliiruegeria haliotis]PRY24251.1 hypothetical protein CLV78_103116 [Aliiruegeria haliotis]